MNNPYYTSPSPLGAPIIKLFGFVPSGECIDTIESMESNYGWKFSDCQVLKYLWRLGVKNDDIKGDCFKILDYIDRAIVSGSHITDTLKIVELHLICLMKRNGIE